jgi:hypothetical protein
MKVKIKKIVEDLNSGNATKISAAISALQVNGDVTVLKPLAEVLCKELDPKNKQEIIEFFSTLNDSSSVDAMIELVKDTQFIGIRSVLLSTLWNSKLDYSYYLPEFVEIACEGDFMEALECLTIIENMESAFEERHILEAQLHLKDYMENPSPKDPKKAQIMSEIALLLKDFIELDDDDISQYLIDED